MKNCEFIGRIGALAVALGVGSALAGPAGIAWASPESTSDSPAADTSPPSDDGTATPTTTDGGIASTPDHGTPSAGRPRPPETSPPPAAAPAEQGSVRTVEVSPGVTISSSGGAHTSTHHTGADEPTPEEVEDSTPDEPPETAAPTSHDRNDSRDHVAPATRRPASSTAAQTTVGRLGSHESSGTDSRPPESVTAAPPVLSAPPADLTLLAPTVVAKLAPASIATLVRNAVAPMFASLLAALERGWADSPMGWILLAAARREIDSPGATTTDVTAQPTATAQPVAAAPPNAAPTASAVFTTTDPATGAVKGQLVGSDPEGKKVTFAVTVKPTVGTLVYDSRTASFTYTPTAAQRILAGATAEADTVGMTITASDGVNVAPIRIDVPVAAISLSIRTDLPGTTGAGGLAATNTRLYVTNRSAGTITVIDTVTGTVVGTFAAGVTPDGIAVKQDGTRLYVSSSTNDTLTVIDTATGLVKATIAVSSPIAPTMTPTGASVYVLNADTATVTRISTSTNRVAQTYQLPPGSRPTGLVASTDNTKVYVTGETPTGTTTLAVFTPSSRSAAVTIGEFSSGSTGLALSPDNLKLYVGSGNGTITVLDTKSRALVTTMQIGGAPSSIAVSRDGSALVVTDALGRVAAFDASTGALLDDLTVHVTPGSPRPASVLSPDGTEAYVSDPNGGVVHVVSLTAPNARPTVGVPTTGPPAASTGTVTGTVGVTDSDGDRLTYTVSGAPGMGKVVLRADGTFTYTPTAVARHAASTTGAGPTIDTFTVTVDDGRRGAVTALVSVTVSPLNKAPSVTTTVGSPNAITGVVTGTVKGTDGDRDVIGYAPAQAPAKGNVTISATGAFTYTPTAAARHAAMRAGASAADKQDAFTVAVDDGHGGVVTVAVTVKIGPVNAKPANGTGTVAQTDPRTGVVTGTLTATDLDGDTLTFTAAKPKKGTLVVRPDGTFTYTPTDAARAAATAPNASAATKTESIAITVTDGYGGTATFGLVTPIAPYPSGNRPPTNVQNTPTGSSSAIGTVTGTVSATDPDGDPLTYAVTGGPTKGVVTLNPTTGAYSYTPTVEARYTALVTPGVDTDAFTVTVSDALGGTTTTTVSVTVVPPSATAVDQRPTTVAINVPDFLFYTPAQLSTALDALQATGISTVRVLVAWASIEPLQGWYDWSATDRVISAATARGMTVLGVLNSTPFWAVEPGTMPVSGRPANPAQFATFARLVATRYAGKVASYEVWNEPNGFQFWQPGPDAAQYTQLLKAAYTAIKTADPNAMVVAAAVGAVIDFGNFTVNPVRFISEMYAAGAAGYFDALSFHPYLYNNEFSEGGTFFESPLMQVTRIRNLMVANGDGNKKIWATEYGQPASVSSEANQAAFIGDFLRAWRDLPFAGPAFLHTLVDWDSSDPVEATFGLYHRDWTPKPAVAVVQQVIAENAAIEQAASDGVRRVL